MSVVNASRFSAGLVLAAWLTVSSVAHGAAATRELTWDDTEKTFVGHGGEETTTFVFTVRNDTDEAATITKIEPSCGCTVVEQPAVPWTLAPGASRTIRASVDLRGKFGDWEKTLHVVSSLGEQQLVLRLVLPWLADDAGRLARQRAARVDRQAVLRGTCASCHVPASSADVATRFTATCGVCHEAVSRAAMVPDLKSHGIGRDAAYWKKWIAEGKPDTLMPAFAKDAGGIFSESEIDELARYLAQRFAQ